jgi:hypothetical protein
VREAIDRGVPLDQVKRRSNVAVALKRTINSTVAPQKKIAPPTPPSQNPQKKTPAGSKDRSLSWAH